MEPYWSCGDVEAFFLLLGSGSVPCCQILIREHARAIALKFTPKAWMQAVTQSLAS
jgi:hypothetical protein